MVKFKTSKIYKVRFQFPKCLAARTRPTPSQEQGTGATGAAWSPGNRHLPRDGLRPGHGTMRGPILVGPMARQAGL